MTLSQKSQEQLDNINKTIKFLFPTLNKLSDYCRAIGFTNDQLKRMSQEQIEKLLEEVDYYIVKNNIINRATTNEKVISKASTALDTAKSTASLSSHVTTDSSRIGMGEMLRMNRESQDKIDAAIQANLAIKSDLEHLICNLLKPTTGNPIKD